MSGSSCSEITWSLFRCTAKTANGLSFWHCNMHRRCSTQLTQTVLVDVHVLEINIQSCYLHAVPLQCVFTTAFYNCTVNLCSVNLLAGVYPLGGFTFLWCCVRAWLCVCMCANVSVCKKKLRRFCCVHTCLCVSQEHTLSPNGRVRGVIFVHFNFRLRVVIKVNGARSGGKCVCFRV